MQQTKCRLYVHIDTRINTHWINNTLIWAHTKVNKRQVKVVKCVQIILLIKYPFKWNTDNERWRRQYNDDHIIKPKGIERYRIKLTKYLRTFTHTHTHKLLYVIRTYNNDIMSTFQVIGANIWLIKISQERKILKEKEHWSVRSEGCVCVLTFIHSYEMVER